MKKVLLLIAVAALLISCSANKVKVNGPADEGGVKSEAQESQSQDDGAALSPQEKQIKMDMEAGLSLGVVLEDNCKTSCDVDVSIIRERNPSGECVVKAAIPCSPYSCNSKTGLCNSSCTGKYVGCTVGAYCVNSVKRCVSLGNICSASGDYVIRPDQKHISCGDYKCRAGSCMELCQKTDDCKRGLVCNNRNCVSPK